MGREIFILSVFERFALLILEGRKKWEFRENSAFGRDGDYRLEAGDVLFIVASCDEPYLAGYAVVDEILRGEELGTRFNDVAAGEFMNSEAPSVDYIRTEILGRYQVALRLDAALRIDGIPVSRIIRVGTGRPWSGRGFYHVSSLKRYHLGGKDVSGVLADLAGLS